MSTTPTQYVAANAMTFLPAACPFAMSVVKNNYSKSAKIIGDQPGSWAKSGSSIIFRKPYQALTFSGSDQSANFQSLGDQTVTFDLFDGGQPAVSVPWAYTFDELTLFVDNKELMNDTILKPTMQTVGSKLDSRFLSYLMPRIPNVIGTQGVLMATTSLVLQAQARIDDVAGDVLSDNRFCLLTPASAAAMIAGEQVIFNPNGLISKQFETGTLQDAQGLEYLKANQLPVLTMGTATFTSAHIHGSGATGATIDVEGLGAGTVTAGTPFMIAGVYDVVPSTGVRLPYLKTFTVTAAETVASSEATFEIIPTIVTSGAYRNVSTDETANAIPANAVIALVGGLAPGETYRPNIVYNTEAFMGVTVPLMVPTGSGVIQGAHKEWKGMNMTLLSGADIKTYQQLWRWDVSAGVELMRPELAYRVLDGYGS